MRPCFLAHLSLVLICRALASILAPMSPMAFPLMSSLVSEALLPRALRTMERSAFSLESAKDSEFSGCGGVGGILKVVCFLKSV